MTTLFILAIICADPLPQAARDYFTKADEFHNRLVTEKQSKVQALTLAIANEPIRQRKGALKIQLVQAEKELQSAKSLPPTSPLTYFSTINDIGEIPNGTIAAIVDENTAIIIPDNGLNAFAVRTDTKALKIRQRFLATGVYTITDVSPSDAKLQAGFTAAQAARTGQRIQDTAGPSNSFVVKPVDAAQLKKWRTTFDAERKNPVQPAKPGGT